MIDRRTAEEILLEIAINEPADSPEDGAIFFSGPKAKRKAKELAAASDGRFATVIETPALQKFNAQQKHYFGRDAVVDIQTAYAIGDFISEKFAQGASGVVRVFIDGVKPHGTFARAELPALLVNPKVTGFLVYDSRPIDSRVGAFAEMTMNKDELKGYIARKTDSLTPRPAGAAPMAAAGSLPPPAPF